ncbi:hypothetical protein EVAR_76753_1 [Eumeta japonica]|uniref:Uncharacterized protein n=1 Tax=Eumeta variegata TaxID=151549 RepID=A0A4C1SSU5_EUMVA|nr:hypothetical protein EVAR_76753_1 [Eumeta japonica]
MDKGDAPLSASVALHTSSSTLVLSRTLKAYQLSARDFVRVNVESQPSCAFAYGHGTDFDSCRAVDPTHGPTLNLEHDSVLNFGLVPALYFAPFCPFTFDNATVHEDGYAKPRQIKRKSGVTGGENDSAVGRKGRSPPHTSPHACTLAYRYRNDQK